MATPSAMPGVPQPLSTEELPSTSTARSSSTGVIKPLKRTTLQGSIPGGQELKGLGYLKNKPQIFAMEDDEYPAWLWSLLDDAKAARAAAGGQSAGDLDAMTKKQRAKYERKQARLMKNVTKPIPLHEQSRDLTEVGDDAITSLERRQDLTKSARGARRKGIREDNFLRGM